MSDDLDCPCLYAFELPTANLCDQNNVSLLGCFLSQYCGPKTAAEVSSALECLSYSCYGKDAQTAFSGNRPLCPDPEKVDIFFDGTDSIPVSSVTSFPSLMSTHTPRYLSDTMELASFFELTVSDSSSAAASSTTTGLPALTSNSPTQAAETSGAAASPSVKSQNTGGLSATEKVGIGIGVPFAFLVLAASITIFMLFLRRRRRRRLRDPSNDKVETSPELEDTSPPKGLPGLWYRAELESDRDVPRIMVEAADSVVREMSAVGSSSSSSSASSTRSAASRDGRDHQRKRETAMPTPPVSPMRVDVAIPESGNIDLEDPRVSMMSVRSSMAQEDMEKVASGQEHSAATKGE